MNIDLETLTMSFLSEDLCFDTIKKYGTIRQGFIELFKRTESY